jgi:uncharacterized membrane protein YphA (DoxX/SURF4 family)
MKEQVTLEGRSLVFNIVMVVLNLTGLTFLVMGYHENFVESSTLFKFLGLILMIGSIGGLVIFKGRYLMSSVARVLVGGLFIVSGLVKANDPLGFSYKLEEYFEDGALAFRIKEWFGAPGFSMEYFIDFALFLSVLICIAEIVLGVLTIIGGKIKLVSYSMLIMMLFFTFLTWHTANCDKDMTFVDRDTYAMTDPVAEMKIESAKTDEGITVVSKSDTEVVIDEVKAPQCVSDCGCFGDAMKGSVGRSLTPKESLWKDIVLVYLVLWIFVAQWIVKPNTRKQNMVYTVTSMLMIVFFSWVFGWYFPVFFGLISIVGALWMLRVGGKFLGNYYGAALLVTVICLFMTTYVLMYEPLKDYRAYAVGANLVEKMNDGVDGVYENVFVYKNSKTGEKKEMTEKEYMDSKIWEDTDWVYEDRVQKTIVAAINPTVMDFKPMVSITDLTELESSLEIVKSILDTSKVELLRIYDKKYDDFMEIPFEEYSIEGFPAEEYEIRDTVVNYNPELTDIEVDRGIIEEEKIVILISRRLSDANWSSVDRAKEIFESCKKKGVPFIMICNGTRAEVDAFRKKHEFDVPIFMMDETELKIVSRSNPALVVLEKGVVKAKYAFRSIPTKESFKEKHLK